MRRAGYEFIMGMTLEPVCIPAYIHIKGGEHKNTADTLPLKKQRAKQKKAYKRRTRRILAHIQRQFKQLNTMLQTKAKKV